MTGIQSLQLVVCPRASDGPPPHGSEATVAPVLGGWPNRFRACPATANGPRINATNSPCPVVYPVVCNDRVNDRSAAPATAPRKSASPDQQESILIVVAYYADLTPYQYGRSDDALLNVGWLDSAHSFEVGGVTNEFSEALTLCAAEKDQQTRGYHDCEFCSEESPIRVKRPDGSRYVSLGMSEIHVVGEDGQGYAAPSLVVHYVLAHNYRPPTAFQAAVVFDNASRSRPAFVCPVCGYPELDELALSDEGAWSGRRCPSCGTRFNMDLKEASTSQLRDRWIELGMPWSTTWIPAPIDWNPTNQLSTINRD